MRSRKNNWTPPDPRERVREISIDPKDPPPVGYDRPCIQRKPKTKPVLITDVLKTVRKDIPS